MLASTIGQATSPETRITATPPATKAALPSSWKSSPASEVKIQILDQAGLGALTAEEFARFTHLNELYKSKFDFPFIFAVKGATKQQILASFVERVNHSKEDEFTMALDQVCRIFRFRIEDRVAP